MRHSISNHFKTRTMTESVATTTRHDDYDVESLKTITISQLQKLEQQPTTT